MRWDAGVFARVPGPAWFIVAAVSVQAFWPGALGFWHWNLGAGAMLGALLVAPARMWPWIVLGTGLSILLSGWLDQETQSPLPLSPILDFERTGCAECVRMFIGHWADALLVLLPVWWLQGRLGGLKACATPQGMAILHLGVLAAAALQTLTDVLWVLGEGFVADTRHREVVAPVLITAANAAELLGAFFLKNALGYFLGAMLVIPLLLWLALPELRRGSGPMLKEVGLVLLPAAGAFLTLLMIFPEGRLAELLRLLLIAAVVVFAVRHGLRGAALSVLVVSLALGIEDHLWGASDSIIWLQTFVAIAGAMALMFGASMDQLRLQTAQLRQAREREQRILHDLAEAAARNVRAQELERGRIAMDLHDSLGQDITALQTELKLIQLESEAARPWTHQLLGLALHMRTTLREALEALRPAALVELGLAKAVDLGVIRESAERSGLFFELRLPRDPRALNQLDAATSIAAYRIVQEAVNNVIRHAEAEWVSVRLRVGRRNSRRWLLVSIEDDGRGRSPAVFGRGLQGIRDRAITLTGDLRVTQRCKGGTRVRAWLRLEPEKALGEPYAEPAH